MSLLRLRKHLEHVYPDCITATVTAVTVAVTVDVTVTVVEMTT